MRKLAGYAGLVVGVVAVAMSVYHVYARLTTYAPDQQALLFITLAFSLVLSFLLWPRREGVTPDRVPWSDLALGCPVAGVRGLHVRLLRLRREPVSHGASVEPDGHGRGN